MVNGFGVLLCAGQLQKTHFSFKQRHFVIVQTQTQGFKPQSHTQSPTTSNNRDHPHTPAASHCSEQTCCFGRKTCSCTVISVDVFLFAVFSRWLVITCTYILGHCSKITCRTFLFHLGSFAIAASCWRCKKGELLIYTNWEEPFLNSCRFQGILFKQSVVCK